MSDKSNKNSPPLQVHQLPAGLLPGDYSIELFGVRETRKVWALCDGKTIPFAKINPELHALIFKMMLADPVAMEDLRHMDHFEALEEYAFCMYGDADGAADFTPTVDAGTPENFICGENCRCLKWKSKQILINGHALSVREIQVAQQLASDKPDKLIAHELEISTHTLVQHKRSIYAKAGVQSRPGLVEQGVKQRVIR